MSFKKFYVSNPELGEYSWSSIELDISFLASQGITFTPESIITIAISNSTTGATDGVYIDTSVGILGCYV